MLVSLRRELFLSRGVLGGSSVDQVSLKALAEWTFLPQMRGDQPVEGEVPVRIHFRIK